jgi:hypothetical protein
METAMEQTKIIDARNRFGKAPLKVELDLGPARLKINPFEDRRSFRERLQEMKSTLDNINRLMAELKKETCDFQAEKQDKPKETT